MNKIPNNSHQGPAASAASGVNKVGFWPAKDCLFPAAFPSNIILSLSGAFPPNLNFTEDTQFCRTRQRREGSKDEDEYGPLSSL